MAQYRTGTVNVVNGSATVNGIATEWLAEVSVGDWFVVEDQYVVYQVDSIVSDTEITLSTTYAGATTNDAIYSITRDFTATQGLPLLSPQDIDTSVIWSRAVAMLDTYMDGLDTAQDDYLLLAGGTMSGDIDLDGNTILNPGDIDLGGNSLINPGQMTMAGDLNMGSYDIVNADNVSLGNLLSAPGNYDHILADTHINNTRIAIAQDGTGDRNTYIDFMANDTHSQASRLIRWAGENGNLSLENRGGGLITLLQKNSGTIQFRTDDDANQDIRIANTGKMWSANTDYEDLITADDDFTTKKYVDVRVEERAAPNANLIVNPCMRVSQEAVQTLGTANKFICDRFKYISSGYPNVNTYNPRTVSLFYRPDITAAARVYTTATHTPVSGNYSLISYCMEGYEVRRLWGQTFTISFWAYANRAGIYSLTLRNSAYDRSYVSEYTMDLANAWEFKTITMTLPTSVGGTWNEWEEMPAANFFWALGPAPTFQTSSLDQWVTGNYFASTNQTNLFLSTAHSLYITGVKVELGENVTRLDVPDFALDLQSCQRHYETSFKLDYQYPGDSTGAACITKELSRNVGASGYYWDQTTFQVKKRANPSVTLYSPAGTVSAVNVSGTSRAALPTDITQNGFGTMLNNSGVTWTSGQRLQYNWVADNRIQ